MMKNSRSREKVMAFEREVLNLLGAKTVEEGRQALQTVLAGASVAAVLIVYRPLIPGEYRVATVGVSETPASLFALNDVLGRVRDEIFVRAMRLQQASPAQTPGQSVEVPTGLDHRRTEENSPQDKGPQATPRPNSGE